MGKKPAIPTRRSKRGGASRQALSLQTNLVCGASIEFPCSSLPYLLRPPPPPRLPPPPPRLPILEAPRELLARAELPLVPPPPPRAFPREPPPPPDDTLRLPTRSPPPPPPRFAPRSLVPALGRLPPRSPAPPRSPTPPRLPAPPCCRCRAFAWRFAMESPRAVPPNLSAVERLEY